MNPYRRQLVQALVLLPWAGWARAETGASDLLAAIQDAFNRHGVQIMSPHYFRDPPEPKLVPAARWYVPPAERKEPQ